MALYSPLQYSLFTKLIRGASLWSEISDREALQGDGWRTLYIILASLALGRRVISAADPAAIKRLQTLLYVKRSKRFVGLIADFALSRRCEEARDRSAETKGMDFTTASRHLLLRWDPIPLVFDFGGSKALESTTESGESGGGGGGGHAHTRHPTPVRYTIGIT